VMLLCLSSCCFKIFSGGVAAGEDLVEFAGDVAFEAAHDVLFGQSVGGAAGRIGAGAGAGRQAG
jgi:hypothetical protein